MQCARFSVPFRLYIYSWVTDCDWLAWCLDLWLTAYRLIRCNLNTSLYSVVRISLVSVNVITACECVSKGGYMDDIPLHQARIRRQRYLTVGYMSPWGIQSIPKASYLIGSPLTRLAFLRLRWSLKYKNKFEKMFNRQRYTIYEKLARPLHLKKPRQQLSCRWQSLHVQPSKKADQQARLSGGG